MRALKKAAASKGTRVSQQAFCTYEHRHLDVRSKTDRMRRWCADS